MIRDMKRTGLFPEHSGAVLVPPWHDDVRLTIPAREALEECDAEVIPTGDTYSVRLGPRVPAGLVVVRIFGSPDIGIRLKNEPKYPNEVPGGTLWEQADFSPCPKCGAPLIWYEAGYVPGYRVCAGPKHHHMLVY